MLYDYTQLNQGQTRWEKVASTRWGTYVTDIEKRTILKAHDLSKKPDTALEIGVEGGRWSKLLAELGWSMTCTDVNHDSLEICKNRIPTANCILVTQGQKEIPLESQSVGLILCIEVAPVIQSDWFIDETYRVLQNNGLIVGVFWNQRSLRGLFAHTRAFFTNEYDHYTISYPTWRKTFLNSGYSILHEQGLCWLPFGRASNSAFIPHLVHLEKWLGLQKLTQLSPWIAFIAQKTS